MKLTVKPQDVLRSKTMDPGWYVAKITKMVDKPAVKDGSMNTEMQVEIVSPAGGGETPYKGVPIMHWFNEKYPQFTIEFIEAMGGTVSETKNVEFELGVNLVGKPVEVNVINEMYLTRMTNKIANFRAHSKSTGVPTS